MDPKSGCQTCHKTAQKYEQRKKKKKNTSKQASKQNPKNSKTHSDQLQQANKYLNKKPSFSPAIARKTLSIPGLSAVRKEGEPQNVRGLLWK